MPSYEDLRIYTTGETVVSKRDGQSYTVLFWDEDSLSYTLESRYVRITISCWDMESF